MSIEIGKIYDTKYDGQILVVSKSNNPRYYNIRFINTGYEKSVRGDHIISGQIRDNFKQLQHGGVIGNVDSYRTHILYTVWNNMMNRCYNINNKSYCDYGAIGVCVEKSWHCFEKFIHDAIYLQGYNLFINNPHNYQLDKDYLQLHIPKCNRIYSKETCMFISNTDNLLLRNYEYHINNMNNKKMESKYIGVYKRGNNSWCAIIGVNGTRIKLGTFDNEIAAASAYNYAYRKYYSNSIIDCSNRLEYEMQPNEFLKHNKNIKQMVYKINDHI